MKNKHRYLILLEIAILIFIVLRLINIGGEPVFSSNSGSYVVPGTMTREFSFFDYISFLEFRADEYFDDYALVVRISFMIVLLSTIVLLGIVGRISYEGYVYRQQARRLNHFVKKYYNNFVSLLDTCDNYSKAQIREKLELKDDYSIHNMFQVNAWYELYTNEYCKLDKYSNRVNLHNLLDITGFKEYCELVLISGSLKDKIKVLQISQMLMLPISISYVSRLINHKDSVLRKEARIFYMLNCKEDPYAMNLTDEMTHWDKMQMHMLSRICVLEKKQLPSFLSFVERSDNPVNKAFFVEEVGFWSSKDDVKLLIPLVKSSNEKIARAAIKSMARNQVAESVETMQKVYISKSDHERRLILRTLFLIHSGHLESFYKNVYECSASFKTRRVALLCLFGYSTEGQNLFHALLQQASSEEKVLFEQVMNTIYLDRIYRENVDMSLHHANEFENITSYVSNTL
jgi:hypothetical protein